MNTLTYLYFWNLHLVVNAKLFLMMCLMYACSNLQAQSLFQAPNDLKTTKSCIHTEWFFDIDNDAEGWYQLTGMDGTVAEGVFTLTTSEANAFMISPANIGVNTSEYPYLRIRLQSNQSGNIAFFWSRNDALGFIEAHSAAVSMNNSQEKFVDYILDLSQEPEWKNIIYQIRIDIESGSEHSFQIDEIVFEKEDKRNCVGVWAGDEDCTTDTDWDTIPDILDLDDDNDGTPDTSDPNPLVPIAVCDKITITEGSTASIDILSNDDFVPGDFIVLSDLGIGSAAGSINFNEQLGVLEYSPLYIEAGSTVDILYSVCNTAVIPPICAGAKVSITVAKDNDRDGIADEIDTDDDNDGNPDISDPHPLIAIAVCDKVTVAEGTTTRIDILANDDFIAGDFTSITAIGTGNAKGTISFNEQLGTLEYTPVSAEVGSTVDIMYKVCNTEVDPPVCAGATVAILVDKDTDRDGIPNTIDTDDDNDGNPDTTDPTPLAAIAICDKMTMSLGSTGSVDILSNDDFIAGDFISLSDTGTGSAGGAIHFNEQLGVLEYTPLSTEAGSTVEIVYKVCNMAVTPPVCAGAIVSITVTDDIDTDGDGIIDTMDTDDDNDGAIDELDVNPLEAIANDDTVIVTEEVTGYIDILSNDDFIPGSAIHIVDQGTGTASGVVSFNTLTGIMEYTPLTEEADTTVSVVYEVCNATVNPEVCTTATVFITVAKDTDRDGISDMEDTDDDNDGTPDINDPNPLQVIARGDILTLHEGTVGQVDILSNDDFSASEEITIRNTGLGTALGVVEINTLTGILTYEPLSDETGNTVSVVYEVCNTAVSTSVCATATLLIVVEEDTNTDSDEDGISDLEDMDDDNDGNPDTSDPNPLEAIALGDLLTVREGTLGSVNILSNDDFIPGEEISIINLNTGSASGTIHIDPHTGILEYAPLPIEKNTMVSVDYEVCNTAVSPEVCAIATLIIMVEEDTNVDSDGDGISDYEEQNRERDPNSAVDLAFDFSNATEGWNALGTFCIGCDEGLTIHSNNQNSYIYRENLLFNADDVGKIETKVWSENTGNFTLLWATTEQSYFSASRSITMSYTESREDQQLSFALKDHPEWDGKVITKLQLKAPQGDGTVRIYYLDAIELQQSWSFKGHWDGWSCGDHMKGEVNSSDIDFTITGANPSVTNCKNVYAPSNQYPYLRLRLKTQNKGSFRVYWSTNNQMYEPARSANVAIDSNSGEFQDVVLELGEVPTWNGSIWALRIDPDFEISDRFQIDLISFEKEDKRDCYGVWKGDSNCTMNVEDRNYKNEISIYPVPATDTITISAETKIEGTLHIYSALGQQILAIDTAFEKKVISVADFAPGVYFMTVQEGGVMYKRSFTVN